MLALSDNVALSTSMPFVFDGNPDNTIAWIFAFRVWSNANDFLSNTSLFRKITCQLEPDVQQALARYVVARKTKWLEDTGVTREKVRKQLIRKKEEEDGVRDDDSEVTEISDLIIDQELAQKLQAANQKWIVSAAMIESFALDTYPPLMVPRDTIKKQLNLIHFRFNESPIAVMNAMTDAWTYATETVTLLNNHNGAITFDAMRQFDADDMKDWIVTVFSSTNCSVDHGNDGPRNKKIHAKVLQKRPQTLDALKKKMRIIYTECTSQFAIGSGTEPVFYRPIRLPLWESTKASEADSEPPRKRLKLERNDANNQAHGKHFGHFENESKTELMAKCGRCGRANHREANCVATRHQNGTFIVDTAQQFTNMPPSSQRKKGECK